MRWNMLRLSILMVPTLRRDVLYYLKVRVIATFYVYLHSRFRGTVCDVYLVLFYEGGWI